MEKLVEIEKQLQDIRAFLLNMATNDEILTPTETATYLKVSIASVYRLHSKGFISGYKLGKNATSSLRFKKSEILAPQRARKISIL